MVPTKRAESATVDLKLRMKEPLRAEIERSAKQRGISMNAEMIDRMERSLDRENLLDQALGLAYREPEMVALLLMIAEAIQGAVRAAEPRARWIDDPFTFDQAARAASEVLDLARPIGEITVPPGKVDYLGAGCARFVMFRVTYDWSRPYPWLDAVRRRAGTLLERFKARWNVAGAGKITFATYDWDDYDRAHEAFSALTEE